MEIKELYWAAGFLDGEGHIGFYGDIKIRAAQTHLEPLQRLQSILGGKLYGPYKHKNKPKHKPYYYYGAGGSLAASIVMTLYSILGSAKREQARKALELWKARLPWTKFRTHCPQGHLLSGSNVYMRKEGWRGCKTCLGRKNH